MLAPKKGETTSLSRYMNVFRVLSIVISICLLNACNVNGTTTEAEPNFASEHIVQSCIEKCPDQNQNASSSVECIEQCGQNQMKNSTVAAAFIWMFMINSTYVTKQVRITGTISEVSENEIAEFFKEEDLISKIRIKICPIGAEVDWNELKAKHDQVLKDYQEGRETLPQTKSYTALKIRPQKMYFYLAEYNKIADRVKYELLQNGTWINYHIAS